MVDFWLDSGVFIAPSREGYYDFDLAPTYWQFLERKADEGVMASIRKVCDELLRRRDNLSNWVDARRYSSLFQDPDEQVQNEYTRVADYVMANYRQHRAEEFLGGADPWLIAHAIASEGEIVTYEHRGSLDSQQVRIPNVSQAFNVTSISLFEMFRELKIEIEFKG